MGDSGESVGSLQKLPDFFWRSDHVCSYETEAAIERLYAHRIAGRHRDYRGAGLIVAARGAAGARGSSPYAMQKQPEATRAGDAQLS